jgi:putative ABC transport system ATP-binding protein
MSLDATLEVRDLVKSYGTGETRKALDGLSFRVPAGRFLSVMGPSGSGKSTLLHLLGGLDRPTGGEVLIGGRSLSGLSDREITELRRHQIGFVFQFFNLIPVLTVEENIALPVVVAGANPRSYAERLAEMVDRVGLEGQEEKLPGQLSGGQQQRVAVARALFIEPTVLLADEPTGNLDSRTGAGILRMLRQANQDFGTTIVMVTHDARAAAYGDEILLLVDGAVADRLVFEDPPDLDRRHRDVLTWLQGFETTGKAPAPDTLGSG